MLAKYTIQGFCNELAAGLKIIERFLVKRFASCEEVTDLLAYLCSSAAAYVNGDVGAPMRWQ
jgi:hypothetical protein